MTTKIKTTLMTVFFIFGLLTGIQAQDKYEVARILYHVNLGANLDGIYVTISGKETELVKVEKKKINSFVFEYKPIVDYIQKMLNEGWEIISVLPNNEYYLKRKIN